MEPSTRAPFTEITQHLEWILEQLPEPAPIPRASLLHSQGTEKTISSWVGFGNQTTLSVIWLVQVTYPYTMSGMG
ncbi:hypothetical protein CB1_106475001 [Camelus ferus]|nr:hypothetical protein CB1_106475001 [Camelus ferus]